MITNNTINTKTESLYAAVTLQSTSQSSHQIQLPTAPTPALLQDMLKLIMSLIEQLGGQQQENANSEQDTDKLGTLGDKSTALTAKDTNTKVDSFTAHDNRFSASVNKFLETDIVEYSKQELAENRKKFNPNIEIKVLSSSMQSHLSTALTDVLGDSKDEALKGFLGSQTKGFQAGLEMNAREYKAQGGDVNDPNFKSIILGKIQNFKSYLEAAKATSESQGGGIAVGPLINPDDKNDDKKDINSFHEFGKSLLDMMKAEAEKMHDLTENNRVTDNA